jgi:MIP family channel proteins
VGVAGVEGVALAHGLVLMVMVFAFGGLSGAHVNPAVTLGLLVRQQIALVEAIGYWVVQLLGGTAAGFLLLLVLGGPLNGLGATVLAPGAGVMQGLVIEAVLTFLLVTTVFRAAVRGKAGNVAGLAIGGALAAVILIGGPLTGASVNPARSVGPAIASGLFNDLWIYVVGPALGGLVAAGLDRAMGDA